MESSCEWYSSEASNESWWSNLLHWFCFESLEISNRSWPLELVCPPQNSLFSWLMGSKLFLEFNAEGSNGWKTCPLEIVRQCDRTELSSLRLFAHAKPLDVETCNGPEKGISPWDAFFIWEASSGLQLDGFCASSHRLLFSSLRMRKDLPDLPFTLWEVWVWLAKSCKSNLKWELVYANYKVLVNQCACT